MDAEVTKLLDEFEAECAAAGVTPVQALVAGGLDRGQWRRWRTGPFMPTMRSLKKARAGLNTLTSRADRQAAALA